MALEDAEVEKQQMLHHKEFTESMDRHGVEICEPIKSYVIEEQGSGGILYHKDVQNGILKNHRAQQRHDVNR